MNAVYLGKQRGAALFVALIMLLLITMLAISSVRQATIESRVTGNNALQQKLTSSAEAGLREGEISMLRVDSFATEPQEDCPADTTTLPCLLAGEPTYAMQFATAGKSRSYNPLDGTKPAANTGIRWYSKVAPDGGNEAASVNAEYGSATGFAGGNSSATAATVFYYEVNSQGKSVSLSDAVYLRSTIAKISER